MSQTLSRMERLARAEEERKRFRQAAVPQEPSVPPPASASISESTALQQVAPAEADDLTASPPESKYPTLETQASPLTIHSHPNNQVSQLTNPSKQTVAFDATVARETTVASEATVAPDATLARKTTVASDAPVEIRGYGSFTWDLFDRVMPRLDPYEQVVLLRLCRLAWGHKKDTCRVGYERLQQACNLKKRKLQEVISKLEFFEYIRRVSLEQGGSDRSLRGTEYQILLTPPPGVQYATVAFDATVALDATVAQGATNKKKAFKEISKEGLPLRAKACPDCGGTSWVYPNGPEGGVKRCTHPRVPKAGK